MELRTITSHRSSESRVLRPLTFGALLAGIASVTAPLTAQQPSTQELLNRIEAQDRRIERLNQRLNTTAPTSVGTTKQGAPALAGSYKSGYLFRSADANSPFELRINGRLQARYTGFDSDSSSPTAPANSSGFEIERGRLEFRGTFLDKNTHFFINIDADTDDNHRAVFHDFWVNYDIGKNHSVYVGKAFFPGSRDWLSGSTRTHLIDRSLATTFFRPDRTIGIWAIGKIFGGLNYRVMVGNGLNTTDLKPGQTDTNFAYAASLWVDPFADYGKGYADLEHHEQLAMRLGSTFSYTKQDKAQGAASSEAGSIRLSDGMKLSDMGAQAFDFNMAAVDAAMKYRGFSANTEMFYRWLNNVKTPSMPGARDSYYDWGGYCDVGYMIVPKTLEPVMRVSTIQGTEGDSWEYAAGVNYYVNGTHKNKLSFDVSKLDGSPTSNSGPNYRLGDDGWMFRLQWQIAF